MAKDAMQIAELIENYQDKLPTPRFVTDVYIQAVARLAERITAQELEEFVALGALIKERSTMYIPACQWHDDPQCSRGRIIRH